MHIGGNNANHKYCMLGHKLQVVEREKDLVIMLSIDGFLLIWQPATS